MEVSSELFIPIKAWNLYDISICLVLRSFGELWIERCYKVDRLSCNALAVHM